MGDEIGAQILSYRPPIHWFERTVIVITLLHSAGATDALLENLFPLLNVRLVLWLSFYLWALCTLFFCHGIQWLYWFIRFRLLLAVIIAATFASMFWSIRPELSLERSIHLAGTTLFAFYLGYRIPAETAFSLIKWTFIILLFGSFLAAVLVPELGLQLYNGELVWKGLHNNKNDLGFAAVLCVLFFLIMAKSNDTIAGYFMLCLLLVVAMVVLYMSDSVTAFLALIVSGTAALLLYYAAKLQVHRSIIVLIPVALTVMGIVVSILLSDIDIGGITGAFGRSAHLSSRTVVWKAAWSLITNQPWQGMGFGTVWLAKPGMESQQIALLGLGWYTDHAHNGFLQIASELGLPIAVATILFQIQVLIEPLVMYYRRPSMLVLFMIAVQCAFLISNFVEARLFIGRHFHWILYAALPVMLLRSFEQDDGFIPKRPVNSEKFY